MDPWNRETLLDPATARRVRDLRRDQLAGLISASHGVAQEQLAGTAEDRVDAQVVVQNLVAIIDHAMVASDDELFTAGIEAARQIWDIGDRAAMYRSRTPDFEASLWEGLAIELYALGGIAVRHERWAQLRTLTLQYPATTGKNTWLREGQVASSRAARTPDAESVLELAAPLLRHLVSPLRRVSRSTAGRRAVNEHRIETEIPFNRAGSVSNPVTPRSAAVAAMKSGRATNTNLRRSLGRRVHAVERDKRRGVDQLDCGGDHDR